MIRRGVLAAAFASAATAHAEHPPGFELSVVRTEGAGSCPSASEFKRRVSARLGRVPFTDAAEQSIEVTLSHAGEHWSARLDLRDRSGTLRGQRTLEAQGSDCVALADATSLAIALTIDPDAALGPPPAIPESPPQVPLPPPLPPPCPTLRCPAPAPCPACAPPPPARATVTAAARGLLTGGMIPGPAPGVELGAEVGTRHARAQLGLLYLPETSAQDPRFSFGLTTASAGACGAFSLAARLELAACGQVQLGAVYAVVDEIEPIDAGAQPWLALAAGPRLRLDALAPLFFELGGSLVIPLLDRSFEVRGFDSPVYEGGPIAGVGFLGAGFRAP